MSAAVVEAPCKDEDTLSGKLSGAMLSGLRSETFVALARAKFAELYSIELSVDFSTPETLIKEKMERAVSSKRLDLLRSNRHCMIC
jgi:hypothetical protein